MKKITLVLFLFISIFQPIPVIGALIGESSQREVKDFAVRNGLPNFFAKAMNGDSVKVAYLGGSITAQNGWRVSSLNWFKQRFPKAKFSEINAAIGGTGSDFGVFRLRDHVLNFKPDLVFVEFAVNDGNTASQKILRSMEGIVRQTLQQNPFTDICFVYTIKGDYLETEQKGILPNSAENMEKVADHYGIPSINFGFEVARMVTNHQLILTGNTLEVNGIKVFSRDGVHPYPETGHVIYQDILKRSFESMIPNASVKSSKHKLSRPLVPEYFARTQMVDLKEVKLSKNWKVLNINESPSLSGFGRYLKFIGKAGQSGETLSLRFKGRAIGAYDVMGPDAGRIVVEIDGAVKDTIYRFDAYCTYKRMNYFLIDDLKNKRHKIVFKTLCEPFDKALILKKRNEVIKNADDYKEYNWYVGKILVDGTLLK
ncbi:MAG: SGNH/GDSL hydrolase family protein [Prolixibacteraceae bacterium]|nr:SGNH/GDSL hydrolase family protein [Prolixibacteraceae bacterium]